MNISLSDLQLRKLGRDASRLAIFSIVQRPQFRHLKGAFAVSLGLGATLMFSTSAFAQCATGASSVTCTGAVVTTDADDSRVIVFNSANVVNLNVNTGSNVTGYGLYVRNDGVGSVVAVNSGNVQVNAGNTPANSNATPSSGAQSAALALVGRDVGLTGSGTVSNLGTGSAIYLGVTGDGDALLNTTGAVSAANGHGVEVTAANISGNVDVTTADVTAGGSGSSAIRIISNSEDGSISVVANGNLSGSANGVVANLNNVDATGNIGVTTQGVVAGINGIEAVNDGSGTVTVVAGGAVNAQASGVAILARGNGGAVSVTSAGAITGGSGIQATNTGSGTITVNANGAITASSGLTDFGILAVSGGGLVNVATTAAVSGNTGIAAGNLGNGGVTVTAGGAITGTAGFGVVASGAGGNISVTTAQVSAANVANGAAVVAEQASSGVAGNIAVTLNGNISGQAGVVAKNNGTGTNTITQTVNSEITTANGHGISSSATSGATTINVRDKITAAGAGMAGVHATSVAGAIGVVVTASTGIINSANGIDFSTTSGALSTNNSGSVTGTTAGIRYVSATGNMAVTNQATGTVSSANNAIDMTATGSATATVTNSGLIDGTVMAIRAAGTTGNMTVTNSATGRILSANTAVNLAASGTAASTVTNNGAITGTAVAVRAASTTGAMTVTNNATGTISSANTAINLSATGNAAATITNSGSITGTAVALQAAMTGGAVNFTNNGNFNGRISVAGSNVAGSTLTNSATGVGNFGTGASSYSGNLNNAGVLHLGAAGTLSFAGNVTNSNRINLAGGNIFTTTGNMANTGVVSAQNGVMSDRIVVVGNYAGGGEIWADFSDQTLTADAVTIGGNVTGTTTVRMTRSGGIKLLPDGFLPVVFITGAAPSADAFVGTIMDNGLILETVAQNPDNVRQFGVLQEINPQSLALSSINLIAEAASGMLDEPMKPYITSRTDVGDGGGQVGIWTRLGGGHADQSVTTAVAGGDLALASVDSIRTNYFTAQLGLDFAAVNLGGSWDLHFGVMGGWYSGRTEFGPAQSIKVETPFAGIYALASNGNFALEGSARREWRNYKIALPSLLAAGPQKLDGKSWAFAAHASYRVGGETGLFATPFIGYQYADSDIDDLDIGANAVFTSAGDKTKIGRAGGRIGYRFGEASTATVEPFGGVSYLRNWSQRSDSSYIWDAPNTVFTSRAHTWKDVVRYTAGVDIRVKHSRVTSFVAANFDDDKQRDSTSVHAGLRINF